MFKVKKPSSTDDLQSKVEGQQRKKEAEVRLKKLRYIGDCMNTSNRNSIDNNSDNQNEETDASSSKEKVDEIKVQKPSSTDGLPSRSELKDRLRKKISARAEVRSKRLPNISDCMNTSTRNSFGNNSDNQNKVTDASSSKEKVDEIKNRQRSSSNNKVQTRAEKRPREVSTKHRSEHAIKDATIRMVRLTDNEIDNMLKNIEPPRNKRGAKDNENKSAKSLKSIASTSKKNVNESKKQTSSSTSNDKVQTRAKKWPKEVSTKHRSEHKVKEVTVRMVRLSKNEIREMIKNVENPQSKLHLSDNGSGNECCNGTGFRMTRSAHRSKTSSSKGIPNQCTSSLDNKKSQKFGPKPKIHRRKKLTLAEKIQSNAPGNEFMINEIILATIPGYCPWTARINKIIGETIMVEFFGTGQINPVRSTAVTRFELNKVIPFLARKGYKKAMEEVEFSLQIPADKSIFP